MLTEHIKPYRSMLLLGLGLGLLFGLVDAVVDAVIEAGAVTRLTAASLAEELFAPGPREVWARSFVLGLFVLFAVHIAYDRRRADRAVARVAFHDPITGLPNRALLQDRLAHDLAHARRHQQPLAVLFLDLDNFKAVNDTCGHAAGDRLLAVVAGRFAACLRAEDTLARMGGDEFVVVLRNVADSHRIATVAQKILRTLRAPFPVCGSEIAIGASIGIAVWPHDGGDAETLLKHADTAMYHVKAAGKGGYEFYTPGMSTQAQERLRLEGGLREALSREEFELHYEPRVDPRTGAPVAAEALLRWHHPRRGLLPPTAFMALAREMGLAVPLGTWVLRTACAQAAAWQGRGALRVSVNVCAQQWLRQDFVATVRQALADTNLPASALELEIAEDAVGDDTPAAMEETRTQLQRLQAVGVTLTLDRFGAGPAALARLARLPFDRVKIDRAVVADLLRDDAERAIVDSVMMLARRLGVAVTAVGVDTAAQLAALADCDEVQGRCLGEARPAARMDTLLAPGVGPDARVKAS